MSKKIKRNKKKFSFTKKMIILLALAVVIIILVFLIKYLGDVDVSDNVVKATTTASETDTATTTPAASSALETTTEAETTTTTAPVNMTDGGHFVQGENSDWRLKLVNKWNTLDRSYSQPLVNHDSVRRFDERALQSLRELISAGSDYNVFAASTFRDIDLQKSLYDRKVNELVSRGYSRSDAEEEASTVVARPGQSEHNLGLAVDFTFSGKGSLEQSMENTDGYRWLVENCADYGFILRFPKGKEDITGVMFEPWHYRYVGEEHAKKIMKNDLTLEEYLEAVAKGTM